jgi:hypothetical protein
MAAFALWADFTSQGFAPRKCALLIIFTAFSAALAHAQKPPMVDVGVVLPQDVITGETVSGSIVVNPNDYANIPGLHRRSRSGIFLRTQQASRALRVVASRN